MRIILQNEQIKAKPTKDKKAFFFRFIIYNS